MLQNILKRLQTRNKYKDMYGVRIHVGDIIQLGSDDYYGDDEEIEYSEVIEDKYNKGKYTFEGQRCHDGILYEWNEVIVIDKLNK